MRVPKFGDFDGDLGPYPDVSVVALAVHGVLLVEGEGPVEDDGVRESKSVRQ